MGVLVSVMIEMKFFGKRKNRLGHYFVLCMRQRADQNEFIYKGVVGIGRKRERKNAN